MLQVLEPFFAVIGVAVTIGWVLLWLTRPKPRIYQPRQRMVTAIGLDNGEMFQLDQPLSIGEALTKRSEFMPS